MRHRRVRVLASPGSLAQRDWSSSMDATRAGAPAATKRISSKRVGVGEFSFVGDECEHARTDGDGSRRALSERSAKGDLPERPDVDLAEDGPWRRRRIGRRTRRLGSSRRVEQATSASRRPTKPSVGLPARGRRLMSRVREPALESAPRSDSIDRRTARAAVALPAVRPPVRSPAQRTPGRRRSSRTT